METGLKAFSVRK